MKIASMLTGPLAVIAASAAPAPLVSKRAHRRRPGPADDSSVAPEGRVTELMPELFGWKAVTAETSRTNLKP